MNLFTDKITKLQKNISYYWFGLSLIPFLILFLFGYALLEKIADWQTNRKVLFFCDKKKKLALFLLYV